MLLKAVGLAFACAVLGIGNAGAQSYPTRPVRLVVPFSAGGSVDILGRLVAGKLSASMRQPFVVDNKPGAAGNLGADVVAKADPDGYTLLLASVSFAINPSLYRALPFDPVKDLTPVGMVASAPNVLVVNPSVDAKDLAQFVAVAKRGNLFYASAGSGTPTHLAAELFGTLADVKMTHVPYKGGGPAFTDLVGGRVQVMFAGVVSALPFVKDGRLRALAVTGLDRSKAAPNLPTVAESGYPGYDAVNWFAVLAPSGTPKGIVDRINSELNAALRDPDVARVLSRDGAEPLPMTPAETGKYIAAEMKKWQGVVTKGRITLN